MGRGRVGVNVTTRGDTAVPSEVVIAVPEIYKNFLAQKRWRQWLIGFAFYTALLALYYVEWRRGSHFIGFLPHLLLYGLSFPLWLYEARRPWRYVLDDRRLNLIYWHWGKRFWQWHEMEWRHDVVLSVTEEDWRALPALRLRVKINGQKKPQDLWMVFAHEDAEKVREQALPMIEKYRRQYRHELWADLLRS